ncbi:glycosyltransferase family 4 protein [Desnuesiella massiliensis]|uniref:glycosyltransferase family 4 protein n=1 Tax=Desnuesiella massiliensis TaxID=1650662 RepID=UPI0006E3165D|nr:glycosyltransferase family 1 protein [Desnuesiella massiliensis]
MKIGIDGRAAKWYRGTGIGTYTYQLIKSLNNIDLLNDYLIFMPEDYHKELSLKENFNVKAITKNMVNNFWDEVNIPNILENKEVELYHIPQNGVGLPPKKNCHFVITLHDVIPYKMPETVGERYLNIFLNEMPSIVSRCDGIITVSNYSKEDIAKAFNFPKEKIYVTHLASEEIYKPLNIDFCKNFIKENYGINEDFILYIGGFSPRKNILGLIEAFSNIVNKNKKNIKLVIAGSKGISYEMYKNRTINLKVEEDVLFPGFIPLNHLPLFYNAAELFVYPSFYEGFGLPPLEAMSCGTPVIASNITSIPEILDNGAILINPSNSEELYDAIIKVLEDKNFKNDLILKGLVRSSEFNWNKTAKETLLSYNKIINNF